MRLIVASYALAASSGDGSSVLTRWQRAGAIPAGRRWNSFPHLKLLVGPQAGTPPAYLQT